jgi:hypothetical protein
MLCPCTVDGAVAEMHDKEIEGRRISVVRAIPQDQTAPGTPAAGMGRGGGPHPRTLPWGGPHP